MALFRRKKEAPIRQPHIKDQNESYSFRRSRTLTGSSANSVRVVGESRAQIKSPRIHAHELRQHRRKLLLYLVAVLMVVGLGWALLIQFTGSIDKVIVTPAHPSVPTEQYKRLLNDYFADRPFERFRFALQPEQLRDYLAVKAPEVETLRFDGAQQIGASDVLVTFRQPIVVWEIARQKYYVDADGRAFTHNYYNEPTVVVKDESGIDPSEGAIASTRFLHFLGRVIALMNQSNVATVNSVIIPPNTTREVDLKLTGRDYVIKTLLDRDPAEQVSDILNALRYIDAKGIKPQYIDVRISGRATYKN